MTVERAFRRFGLAALMRERRRDNNAAPAEGAVRQTLKSIGDALQLVFNRTYYFVVSFLGGVVLLVYYGSINFLPELDLGSVLWVLVCVAFVGTLVLLVSGCALVVPGVVWRDVLAANPHFSTLRFSDNQEGPWGFMKWFALPLWLLVVVPFGILVLFPDVVVPGLPQVLFLAAALLAWPTLPSARLFGMLEKEIAASTTEPIARKKARRGTLGAVSLFWMFGVLSWASLMLPFLFVIQIALQRSAESEWQVIGSVALVYIMIIGANLILVSPLKNPFGALSDRMYKIAMAAIVGLVSFLSVASWAPSYVPRLVVRALGLGAIENATLVVADSGIMVLKQAGLAGCQYVDSQPNVIRGVVMLSRLGEWYLLTCKGKDEEYRFTIPRNAVLSWGYEAK